MVEQNLAAFLTVIRACEGTLGPSGYKTLFGGGLFEGYADHPRIKVPFRDTYSTAAGAYQMLASTWDDCKAHLGLPDFSPESQDKAAIYLIQRRGALEDVRAGRVRVAVSTLNKEWASLPGSPYGQPTRSIEFCEQVFTEAGGKLRDLVPNTGPTQPSTTLHDRPASVPNETRKPMGATLLASLLPTILGMFAPKAQQAIQRATGADPAVAQTFTQDLISKIGQATGIAVTDDASAIRAVAAAQTLPEASIKALEDSALSFVLVEMGGGIQAARVADKEATAFWKSPAIWIVMLVFVPPIDYTIYRLVSQMGAPSTELITQTVTAILGLLAVISAFYLGSSVGSQRKDDALVRKL